MKTIILLLGALIAFNSCRKEDEQYPAKLTSTDKGGHTDTIPDKATFKLKLSKDTINYDETLFDFNHTASADFDFNVDAAYFPGFGQVSLASITSDGKDLAIYELPYEPGMSVGLNIHAKADGIYHMGISYERSIPPFLEIWIKDAYEKDSLNLCKGDYSFRVATTDTNTFGSKRFTLLLRTNVQQQTSRLH